jgi:hypothetical protein
VTDHKPLEVIFGPRSKPCACIERWLLRLQGFKYKVVYQSGKNNIADPLSRLPKFRKVTSENDIYEKNLVMFVHELFPISISLNEVQIASREDEIIQQMLEAVKLGQWRKTLMPYYAIREEFGEIEGILI